MCLHFAVYQFMYEIFWFAVYQFMYEVFWFAVYQFMCEVFWFVHDELRVLFHIISSTFNLDGYLVSIVDSKVKK